MKIFFLLFAFAGVATIAVTAQSHKNIPLVVRTAFSQKFPGAENVKWGKENIAEYEAEFEINEIVMSANYLSDGKWLETESRIPVSLLPSGVASAIAVQFPNTTLMEADKIERADKDTLYEVVIKKGSKKKEVIFTQNGIIQK
ncbi:MAG: PepSY-like domain-containing protein [Bacteroidales bacterium]